MISPLPAILYEDGEALVLDKPAELDVTTPRRGGPSVEAMLGDFRLDFVRPPSLVHRLDRDTSGCLLLARNDRAHKRFSAAFEAGQVEKAYLAILVGVPQGEGGEIALPLDKISSKAEGWRMVPSPEGRIALTRWRLIAQAAGRSLVEFRPATGRTHQLRVHAASGLECAIFGDPVYGAGERGGLMLHAASILVPREGKPPIIANAPLPGRFAHAGFAHG